MANTTHIRNIVQECFDKAIQSLATQKLVEEPIRWWTRPYIGYAIQAISEDVKTKPREHVRDDAGHSSSAITDNYVDIELKERHKSAKKS